MSEVPLSDGTNVAIFVQPTYDDLATLDNREREQFLRRLQTLLESDAPRRYVEKSFSSCEELQQFRAGDYLRAYCRLVMDVHGYNVLFLFRISKHNYRQLGRFDARACDRLAELTAIRSVSDVESYLDERDAMTAGDVGDVLERGR